MKSASLVVALVAALTFVCEASNENLNPCKKIDDMMNTAHDFDGHSLIAAWENEYKDSKPETENDTRFKETMKVFVDYLQADLTEGCTQKNIKLLKKAFAAYTMCRLNGMVRSWNLYEAYHNMGQKYGEKCVGRYKKATRARESWLKSLARWMRGDGEGLENETSYVIHQG